MAQRALAHVVERLAGHGGITGKRFDGHEVERGIHERSLSGGTTALDQQRQRLGQQSRDAGQVADQLIGLFADQSAPRVVVEDALRELWRTQVLDRRLPLFERQFDGGRFGAQGGFDLFALQIFQL